MSEGEAYYIHIEFRHTVRTKMNEGKAILVMHFMKHSDHKSSFSVVANLTFSRKATSHFLTCQAVPRQFTCNAFLRSLAPQHGGYKDVDADDIYTRPLAICMRYMCIYACTVLLIGGWAGPFYRFTDSWSLTSLLSQSTLLDSTRESILALRYNFCRLQGTQSWSR